jgi:proline iminopeptidase
MPPASKHRLTQSGLFATAVGEGPLVLAMHGGMGWDHSHLRPWLDPLAENCALVYYDHRGNGRSERTSPGDLSHERWAEDAEMIRTQVGAEQVAIIGSSYGNYIALEYAVRYPNRVSSLVLAGASLMMDPPEQLLERARAAGTADQVTALADAFDGAVTDDASLKRATEAVLPMYSQRADTSVIRTAFARTRYSANAFFAAFGLCLPEYDIAPHLSRVAAPALLISGRHDWLAPPEGSVLRLHELLPRSEHVVFDESRHFPFIDEPERFVAVVGDWLAAHAGA